MTTTSATILTPVLPDTPRLTTAATVIALAGVLAVASCGNDSGPKGGSDFRNNSAGRDRLMEGLRNPGSSKPGHGFNIDD